MTFINNTAIDALNNTNDSTSWLLHLSLWPLRIVCPLLIVFSPIANWTCICVFQSRVYLRSSSRWYFICIAIFDTIYVLVTAPLIFLITFEIYILNWNILFCKLIFFLNYLSCQISAGLLACLSIDRFLATSCLRIYRHHCTADVSKYVCFFVVLMLSIINSHYIIGYSIDPDGYCSTRYYKWYENIYSTLNIVYLLSYSIIPFSIISICNLFIVINVCRNKSNMRKKYSVNKSICSTYTPNDRKSSRFSQCFYSTKCFKKDDPLDVNNEVFKFPPDYLDVKHDSLASTCTTQRLNRLSSSTSESQSQRQNRLSEKLLLDTDDMIGPIELSLTTKQSSNQMSPRDSSFPNRRSSTSSYTKKMCVQLQITISLLVISISFIFCTLPNCISTIRIQTYNHNEHVRKFWQAMNYLSIVPLLITHSVNLIFYYLSSNMFRNCFKEIYLKNSTSTKRFSLKTILKT